MISIYTHRHGETRREDRVDPAWLDAAADVIVWVDLSAPSADEGRLLSDVFHFHPLSVEDALSARHHPKIEPYPGYLYLILHGVGAERGPEFATGDVDFFLGPSALVTVHDGRSPGLARSRELCERHAYVLGEGATALMHRIVDALAESYQPELDTVEEQIEGLEEAAMLGHRPHLMRRILAMRRDLASLRRVLIPQRDVVGRLARREFPQISDEIAYRFRDVYDQFVRLSEEVILFQERLTGILEAHLAAVSNRLNVVMRVLTVISTIFLPLTVLTGMWGMNVRLPTFPGGVAVQFWWVGGAMAAVSLAMLVLFRRNGWI